MPGGPEWRRRTFDRVRAAKAAAAIGVVVILVAILGPTTLTGPAATPGHSGFPVSSQVAVLPTSSPTASSEPWSGIALGPYVPDAELVADDQDRIGIGTTTSFTLRSRTSIPAVELARGLQVDPPVQLSIKAGATADTATVRPLGPLTIGQRYRFRLQSTDGSLAGTWAFRTRAPLHVVGTLPGDKAVEVPTNTGIEITFDQDGVTNVPDHLSIAPNVDGRFEQHGRTWAFVPVKALANATIYTVTVHKGVALTASTETLESDISFRFETTATAGSALRVVFGRSMIESRPGDKTVVLVNASNDESDSLPSSVVVLIHRLPDFKAVVAAGNALAGADSWAIAAPSAVVSTSGLTKVAQVSAPIAPSDAGPIMTIPVPLAAGAYVVTIQQPGAPAQLLIQATNLSAYTMAATQTSIVWVNDLAGDASVAGAMVSISGGRSLGATGSDGILRVTTPAELATTGDQASGAEDGASRAARFLTVSAPGLGSLLVPLGLPIPSGYSFASYWWYGQPSDAWWLLFGTDRTTYRQTDTIHVYGTIRARSDRSVPDGIELRLRAPEGSPDAPILRVPVRATARGVFTTDLRIRDLPRAQYEIDLFVGKTLVSSVWVYVGGIVKPAYQIDIHADRASYLAGQQVTVSTTTAFYDGTPVPGMELQFSAGDQQTTATTDALGRATIVLKAITDGGSEGIGGMEVSVAPVHPEEGQIGAGLDVQVVPSRSWIKAVGAVTGGNIVVTGTLSTFDLSGYEAALVAGRQLDDPSGAPIAGGTIQAQVAHIVQKRVQTGTTYDFIEKRVVPVYESTESEVDLGTRTLKSAADGTFRLALPAPVAKDAYRIGLMATDAQGRTVLLTVDATAPVASSISPIPYLQVPGGCGVPTVTQPLDAPVKLTMRQGDGSVASGGRFLFVVGELGALEATVQTSATLTRPFGDADLPGFTARGVWLTKDGYRAADVAVEVDQRDKAVSVRLRPDRASYQPGDQVTIGVTTLDATGRPVAADVVIQGVDEKLYTLGVASDADPLSQLMAQTAPGFLASYESHAVPFAADGGCGDTGGGERTDFRDTIAFQRIATSASGHGSITFKLSDDLTSWHMSAMAVTGGLDAGQASVLIPVGLPFFADAVLAPEYLVGDQPILRLRGYGAGVASGDHVRFVVSAPSLGLAPAVVEGNAFESLRLALPAMTAGDHAIRIEATGTHAGTTLSDVLVRTVHVVDSRLGTVAASYDPLGSDFHPQGGAGLTTYVVTDAGRGRLIAPLRELAASTSARFDRGAAAELARRLLIDEFGIPGTSLPATGFDPDRYQTGYGVALLPYSSVDLFLTARAALVAGALLDVDRLRSAFRTELDDTATTTRERQIVALAGLAGTGADVLDQLHGYDASTLTVREQLWLALGLAAAGDEASARTIERSVLQANGQRLGPWVRIAAGTTLDDTLEASGLLLLLAARLGDPIASDVSRYLTDHPSIEQVFPLEQLGYVEGLLDRLPRAAGRFAWTVEGQRHDVTLDPGGAFSLVLTPGQRASLKLEPLAGQLAVATTWTATDGALPSDPTMSVTRTVTPAGNAPADQLVHVTLTVSFGAQAPGGCYRLTDLLPSGLAPVVAGAGWVDEEAAGTPDVVGPYEIEGQVVSWCASPQDRSHVYGYSARVVTPGTYRWEPAVVQSEVAQALGASTPGTTYTIR